MKKWRVTLAETTWFEVRGVEAETKEAAEAIVLELDPRNAHDGLEPFESEVESVDAEPEDE